MIEQCHALFPVLKENVALFVTACYLFLFFVAAMYAISVKRTIANDIISVNENIESSTSFSYFCMNMGFQKGLYYILYFKSIIILLS